LNRSGRSIQPADSSMSCPQCGGLRSAYLDWTPFSKPKRPQQRSRQSVQGIIRPHFRQWNRPLIRSTGPPRYPKYRPFRWSELQQAVKLPQVRRPVRAQYTTPVFNIRGIQTSPRHAGSVQWVLLTGHYNRSRLRSGPGRGVPGDGTLPAWSTRLGHMPTGQVYPGRGRYRPHVLMGRKVKHHAHRSRKAVGREHANEFKQCLTSAIEPATRAGIEFCATAGFSPRGQKPIDETRSGHLHRQYLRFAAKASRAAS